jgi:hypothetical protein
MKNTLKLAGTMLGALALGIIVLGCTKKSGTQAQTENIAGLNTTGDDFFFGIETGNGPEYPQFVVDSDGDSFTFRRIKPLKDIRLISIGITFEGKLYEDNVYTYALDETGFYTNIGFYKESKRYGGNVYASVPDEIGSFFIMVSVSETIPNRGISFADEKGNRKYFYISQSGMDGSPLLNEFKNTAKPQKTKIDYNKAYSTLITEWKNDNDNTTVSYALYDINGNGIEELILVHSYYGIAYVYTLKDGKPINLFGYGENNTPNEVPWSRYGSIEILANGLINSMNGDYSIYKIADDGYSVIRIAKEEPYDYENEASRALAKWRYYVMGEIVDEKTYNKFLSKQGYKLNESNAAANIDWKIIN